MQIEKAGLISLRFKRENFASSYAEWAQILLTTNYMTQEKVIACYNKTAGKYGEAFYAELVKKPFDRILLRQFARENKSRGKMIDLGCGPGQITQFLAENGVGEIVGIDISPGMIDKAKKMNKDLEFQVADMLKLNFPDQYFASCVAFYAIVHFSIEQLKKAFFEINRVLVDGGQFLLAFHIGKGLSI